MSQQTEMLQHDAQLILSLFGNAKAQKQRLLTIEKQLQNAGADSYKLHQSIVGLDQLEDPDRYRCRYQPLE